MYAAPERTISGGHSGRARDVWALGCVILEVVVLLCVGFSENPEVEVFEKERLRLSGEDCVKAFSVTMNCVSDWILRLRMKTNDILLGNIQTKLTALLNVVDHMLAEDPL